MLAPNLKELVVGIRSCPVGSGERYTAPATPLIGSTAKPFSGQQPTTNENFAMSLMETIRTRKNEARKDATRAIEVSILTLLIGEIETTEKRTGKPFTDAQVVDSVKKLIKSNDESLKLRANEKLTQENAVLSALLPKQLTEAEIRAAIAENGLQGVPAVMQFLNANYAGQFDKALASSIARS